MCIYICMQFGMQACNSAHVHNAIIIELEAELAPQGPGRGLFSEISMSLLDKGLVCLHAWIYSPPPPPPTPNHTLLLDDSTVVILSSRYLIASYFLQVIISVFISSYKQYFSCYKKRITAMQHTFNEALCMLRMP